MGEHGLTDEEIARIHVEAWDEHQAYIKAGVCRDCGARSLREAASKCRPQQCPSGEYFCGGSDLWEDEDD